MTRVVARCVTGRVMGVVRVRSLIVALTQDSSNSGQGSPSELADGRADSGYEVVGGRNLNKCGATGAVGPDHAVIDCLDGDVPSVGLE